jgi:hypothetical protein
MSHAAGFVGFDEQGRFVHYCFCGAWGAFGFGTNRKADPPDLGRWYCGEHKHLGDNHDRQTGHQGIADPSLARAASEATGAEDQSERGGQAAAVQAGEAWPIVDLTREQEQEGIETVRQMLQNIGQHFRPRSAHKDDILGMLAEMAAASWLDPVERTNAIFSRQQIDAGAKLPDLGDFIDVKGIRRRNDHLIIPCGREWNKNDPTDHWAYLVAGGWEYRPPLRRFRMVGWLWGHEIRQRYPAHIPSWTDDPERRSRWVPLSDLRPPLTLIPILRERQANGQLNRASHA